MAMRFRTPGEVARKNSQQAETAKSSKPSKMGGVVRSEEWESTRKKGLMSFVIPSSIIFFLASRDIPVQDILFRSADWSLAASVTAMYFGLWALKEVGLNLFKYWLMVQRFGISDAHYQLIIGPRAHWNGTEIPTLVKTYTHYRIKVMDAISRRAGHTLINIFRITFYAMIPNNELRLQTAMLQLPIISTLKLLTESGDRFWDIGRFIFQGSRVMDGQYGRFNLVVVNFWAYAGRIIMFQLLVKSQIDEKVGFALFMLAMMPLLWGDTFGEVIGSFFGKHTFKVVGLGEINQKSVEGVVAVFLSSLISMWVAFYYCVDLSPNLFIYPPIVVFTYTSFIACILEAAAPRSTDNFFLEVVSLLVLMFSLA